MTDEIKFDPRNYRIHSDKNKKHIKKSLQRNGAGRSAVMDNQGYLIAGNGVYEQAQALGMGVEIIPSDGTKLIVIKRTDIDYGTDKRKSLALDDNATSDMSNVRNHSNGGYYDICGDICRIMEKQGLILYNEFILVNSIGSGAMRCKGNMKSRKNVRTHQEVLVFYKGNNPLKDVPAEFGDIKFLEMEEQKDESGNMEQASVDK